MSNPAPAKKVTEAFARFTGLPIDSEETTNQFLDSGDPERPYNGHYFDLNCVPWYARMTFAQRLAYLDWIIAIRKEENRVWREEYAKAHDEDGPTGFKPSRFVWGKTTERVRELETQRRIELLDREPLSTTRLRWDQGNNKLVEEERPRYEIYRLHIDSKRWKRARQRKLISVGGRCEYPRCTAWAQECHHLHYETLGFEENTDLEAVCSDHHDVRHGRI
jgi:hypothetical protein